MDLHAWTTQQVDTVEKRARACDATDWRHVFDGVIVDSDTVLRRCEADRRILARHILDPDVTYEPACKGCGTYGPMELANVDNLNDCPELMDLAHAHGITPEILAGLDRPQPPGPEPRKPARLWGVTGAITTSDVPESLRGPRWKP